MKKTKVKRLLAILLSLALFVGTFASTASAASIKVAMTEIKGTGWSSPALSLRNGYKFNGHSAFYAKAQNTASGKAVYCIEMATNISHNQSVSSKSQSTLEGQLKSNGALSTGQQTKLLSYVLYNGYKGNVSYSTWKSQSSSNADLAKYVATQLLIWEVLIGERDINFNYISKSQTGASNAVKEYVRSNNPLRSKIFSYYDSIASAIQSQLKIPSFMAKGASSASTYELTYSNGVYSVSLTDTNGVLGNYSFSGAGLSFQKSGNVLTVTSSQPFDVSTISATKTSNNQTSTLLIWGDGSYSYSGSGVQDVACAGSNSTDPLNGYVKLVAKQATGNLTITKTSEDGRTNFSFRVTGPEGYDKTVTTSAVDNGAKGAVTLTELVPGSYTIEEVGAGKRYTVQVTQNSTVNAGQTSSVGFNNTLAEQYNISVKKSDKETGEALSGAEFVVYADTNGNGQYDEGTDKSVGTMKDNGDGTYSLNNLKYSSAYFVKETKAPVNYQLNTEVFKITTDENTLNYSVECKDLHDKGKIRVVKTDAEWNTPVSGAEFTYYADTNGNGQYDDGVDKAVGTLSEVPAGTYETGDINTGLYFVKETKAPTNYRIDTNVYTANVKSHGYIAIISNATDESGVFINQPMRGNVVLTKIDSETRENLTGAEFTVYADTNGNGQYDDGVDESMGTMSETTKGVYLMKGLRIGLYFVIETAAPYGYLPDETPYKVNVSEDYRTYSVSNDTEGDTASWAYINNPVHIQTEATDSETKGNVSSAKENITLTDKVHYQNLVAGKEYTITGYLMNKKTGEYFLVDGKKVSASTTFTADATEGTVDVTFTFDATSLKGEAVVAYEYLYYVGKEVASHADITDEGQTVYFPDVKTNVTDSETKDHESFADDDVTIIDTVSYKSLSVGKEYTVTGTLMNKETGEAILVDGKPVTASTTFTAESTDGTVDVTFTFDGSALAGQTAVVFEDLYYNNVKVATHADLEDEDQTIHFPGVKTSVKDSETADHFAYADDEVTLVDTVSYTNLTVGKEYTVTGTLMNKETGEAILVDGKPVTASTTFTAESTDGTVDVTFTFDGSALAGQTAVVFEDLYYNNVKVATHADLEDEDQTIHFPGVKTSVKDSETADHFAYADDEVTLVDTVSYTNLTVGKEYTVTGILMNKETGEAILVNGEAITSSVTFTAESADGTVDVTFTFDGSALAGQSAVVFEDLYQNDIKVATHADITDEAQTVHFPDVHTTAKDGKNGDKTLATKGTVVVIDTVSYSNLVVGREYTVTGYLVNKATGEALLVNGEKVVGSTTFTAESADGTVDVTFTFDVTDVAAGDYVVFEQLYDAETGALIASHEDIDDEGQTVTVPEETPKTGDNYTAVIAASATGASALGGLFYLFLRKRKERKAL